MSTVTTDVIPYGNVMGNLAHLVGLNVVGLRRRGFTKTQIHDLRAAYRMMFAAEGTFAERLVDADEIYQDNPEVREIVAFIRSDRSRALCMPS